MKVPPATTASATAAPAASAEELMEAPVQEPHVESDDEMFNPDWGGDFVMPESPQNEPPPLQLALTDVPLPPAGLVLVSLKNDEGHDHNHTSSLVRSASFTKRGRTYGCSSG